MKIKFSTIVIAVGVILVIVLCGGLVSNLLSNVYLRAPKLSTEYVYVDSGDGTEPAIADTVVKISEVSGAERYEIYIDGEYVGYTVKNEFTIAVWTDHVGGDFEVYVKAVRANVAGEKISSKASNVVTATSAAG